MTSVLFVGEMIVLVFGMVVALVVAIVTYVMAGPRLRRGLRIAGVCVAGFGGAIVLLLLLSKGSSLPVSREIVAYRSESTAVTHADSIPMSWDFGVGIFLVPILIGLIVTYVMAGPRLRRGLRIAVMCVLGIGGVGVMYQFLRFDAGPSLSRGAPDPIESAYEQRPVKLSRAVADEIASASEKSESDTRPAGMPAWVRQSPQQTAHVHRRVIEVGPYSTDLECRQFMDEKLVAAADSYLDERVLHGDHRLLTISPTFMRKHVVADEFMKTEKRSFGPLADDQTMYTLYHLLEFDEAVYTKLTERARQATMQSRLTYAGFGLASLMALLTSAFGYLRLDAATEGKYKRSLQWGVGGVVAAIAAGGWLLSQLVVLG